MFKVCSSMSTNSGSAPACEMASVVAINVFGTVSTTSPGCTPHAMMAKRNASSDLLTATEWLAPQKAAKAFSKFSTTGPPMKPAVSRARRNTPVSSFSSSTCGVIRSRKGMQLGMPLGLCILPLHSFIDITQNPGRISSHDRVGWNIFGDDAAGAYDRILADIGVGENRCAGADGCALLYDCLLDLPIGFGLQASFRCCSARISVV